MNFFFILFVPILIFIVNEYFQNKIFIAFERFYKYSKIIALFIPFILIYFNPELVKKLLVYFKDIDKKPIHQNMNDMMGSYFDIKNQNRNKGYYNNVPNMNNMNGMNNSMNGMNNSMNGMNNSMNGMNNNKRNFIHKPNGKIKRNVSESKKKYIASNQKWRCAHCNNMLDNTYEVDHIIALYRGGNNELNNLEALCRNCHGVKTFKEKMNI
jgi:hypothetical protein